MDASGGMSFWATVAAGFVGGLLVVIVTALVLRLWQSITSPEVVIESLGDSISGAIAAEKNSRWYHAGVSCPTDTAALYPTVQVWASMRPGYEVWFFADHLSGAPQPVAIRKTPLRLPLVAGVVGSAVGYVVGRPIQGDEGHLTRSGVPSNVLFTAKPNTRHTFKVRVNWLLDGTKQRQTDAEFALEFHGPESEPTFTKFERRWSARERLIRSPRKKR